MDAVRAVAADVPFLVGLALRAYGERIKDRAGLEAWVARVVAQPDVYVARTRDAAVIAAVQRLFYDPTPDLRLLYLASEARGPWEPLSLLRAARAWGAERGCKRMQLVNDTDIDQGALARRLGPVVERKTYVVEIADGRSSR